MSKPLCTGWRGGKNENQFHSIDRNRETFWTFLRRSTTFQIPPPRIPRSREFSFRNKTGLSDDERGGIFGWSPRTAAARQMADHQSDSEDLTFGSLNVTVPPGLLPAGDCSLRKDIAKQMRARWKLMRAKGRRLTVRFRFGYVAWNGWRKRTLQPVTSMTRPSGYAKERVRPGGSHPLHLPGGNLDFNMSRATTLMIMTQIGQFRISFSFFTKTIVLRHWHSRRLLSGYALWHSLVTFCWNFVMSNSWKIRKFRLKLSASQGPDLDFSECRVINHSHSREDPGALFLKRPRISFPDIPLVRTEIDHTTRVLCLSVRSALHSVGNGLLRWVTFFPVLQLQNF